MSEAEVPTVRVIRILEYQGNRGWIEQTIENRLVKGTFSFRHGVIREGIVGESMAMVEPEVPYGGEGGAYELLMAEFQKSEMRLTIRAFGAPTLSAGQSADRLLDIIHNAGFRLVRT